MKKRTRNIILVIIGVLISLFIFRAFYRNYNFENDNQTLLELKTKAGNGEIKYVLKDWILKENLIFDTLSKNPNAIDLLKNNETKLYWPYISMNPNAIEILKKNTNKKSKIFIKPRSDKDKEKTIDESINQNNMTTEEHELKLHDILKNVWTEDDKEIVLRFFQKMKSTNNEEDIRDDIDGLEALLISIHKKIEKEVKILSSI